MDTFWIDYIIVPLLILLARVVDVSLDTIRVIMVSTGYRSLAELNKVKWGKFQQERP